MSVKSQIFGMPRRWISAITGVFSLFLMTGALLLVDLADHAKAQKKFDYTVYRAIRALPADVTSENLAKVLSDRLQRTLSSPFNPSSVSTDVVITDDTVMGTEVQIMAQADTRILKHAGLASLPVKKTIRLELKLAGETIDLGS